MLRTLLPQRFRLALANWIWKGLLGYTVYNSTSQRNIEERRKLDVRILKKSVKIPLDNLDTGYTRLLREQTAMELGLLILEEGLVEFVKLPDEHYDYTEATVRVIAPTKIDRLNRPFMNKDCINRVD